MKIQKLIRIGSLQYFRSKESESEQMERMERERPMFTIRQQPSNKYDPGALIVEQGRRKIGYVNVDDKKWIHPLMKQGVGNVCSVRFDRVVWPREEGSSAVLKCKVEIEMDEVEEPEAEVDWGEFRYTFPQLPVTSSMDDLHYALEMLRTKLCGKVEGLDIDVRDLLETVMENCCFDMSHETTGAINEICFALEMQGEEEWLEMLEAASTHRRSSRGAQELREWLQRLMESEEADYQWRCYENEAMRMMGRPWVNPEHLRHDMMEVEQQLLSLPSDLYMHIGEPERLLRSAFYLGITEEKQMELLSALVLRETMRKKTTPRHMEETPDEEKEETTAVKVKTIEEKEEAGQKELVDALSLVFKHSHRAAREFVERTDGMKPSKVTQEVSRCIRRGEVDEDLCHRPMWKILHDSGRYKPSESNWNMQISR